ncbi:hypothetical protein PQR34_44795 [Paraburkholderia sediminicola]|uniref:DUF4376 domain-containing protein n=1 Tax=Paraburkholderia sediminicola TaxID=458836 RepID=UPI0038BC9EDD
MITRARIDDGRVVDVLSADPFPEFRPSWVWVNAPPDVQHGWRYADGQFIASGSDIDGIRARKRMELSAACEEFILAGFDSDATGEPHHYPHSDRDQANLHGSMVDAALNAQSPDWTTPLMCVDAGGILSHVSHSSAQTITVGNDAQAFRLAALLKHTRLAKCVAAATTIDEINAIDGNSNEDRTR